MVFATEEVESILAHKEQMDAISIILL